MPRHKDRKRLIRSRMRKTGEAYTAARAQLLAKRRDAPAHRTPAAPAAPPPDYAARAGMSDAAVQARTGRTWAEWVEVLDREGAASLPHREIAERLHSTFGVPAWWAQMVTVGYERIRGLRAIGQRRGGDWEAGKSKTLAVPVAELYRAFAEPRRRARWLPGVRPKVRAAAPGRSLRMTWEDGTAVELWFTAKGAGKSQVAVQHRKLASKADAEARKAYWAERLGALADLLAAAD